MTSHAALSGSHAQIFRHNPAGWSITRCSRVIRFAMGETILREQLVDGGSWPVYSATESTVFLGHIDDPRVRLQRGDLVIPARGNSIGHVKLVDRPATTSQTTIYGKVIDRSAVDPKFVFYYLSGLRKDLFRYTQTAIPQITVAEVGANPFPLIDRRLQTRIVDFLDRETAKIDALIAKQEQLIATLQEDRIATITHAVTQGMDSSVSVGGQSWPGDVPRHWVIGKVKYYFEVVLGKMYQGERKRPGDTLLPHLKAGSLTSEGLVTEDPMLCWFSPTEVVELDLRRGDVLVVEGGSIGRCVVLEQDLSGWGFQKSLNRVRSLGGDLPEFLAYVIEAATASGYVSLLCGKATIPHFTAEKLGAMEFPRPPIDEQRTIVSFLVACPP